MLYCDDCAKPGWPITTRQTMARCDLCLEPRLCNDIDARAMPEARAAREELIEQLGDADVYSQLLRAKVSLAVMLGTVAARSAVGDEAYDLLIASFRDQLVANVTEQAELVGLRARPAVTSHWSSRNA